MGVNTSHETAHLVVSETKNVPNFCKHLVSHELKAMIKQKYALERKFSKFPDTYSDEFRIIRKK